LRSGSARGTERACAQAPAERDYEIVLVDVLACAVGRARAEIEKMDRLCLAYEADVAL
jgi:3-oxoacyl-[acyl-carrier protein] reductase